MIFPDDWARWSEAQREQWLAAQASIAAMRRARTAAPQGGHGGLFLGLPNLAVRGLPEPVREERDLSPGREL